MSSYSPWWVSRSVQIIFILVIMGSLAGCGIVGQGSPTPLPTIVLGGGSATLPAPDPSTRQVNGDGITASGIVVPSQQAQLAFALGGVVKQVNVQLGDQVSAGDALAVLDATDEELLVKQAQAELALAQHNYDLAKATQGVKAEASIAAATLALQEAQNALNQLNQNALLAAAEAQVALTKAQEALNEAQRVRTNMDYPRANQTTIDGAQAFYDLKEDELKSAKDDYDHVRSLAADDPERARALLNLSNAQKERDRALITLNWYLGKNSEQDIAEAEAQLKLAQAQLTAAQQKWEDVKDGPSAADLALVEASILSAQAQLNYAKASAQVDELALAQAQLDAAAARVQMAQAQLARSALTAPFAGTIAVIQIEPGEWVNPGQTVVALAEMKILRIETTDLSERDVPAVEIGQTVSVYIKALGQSITGRVSKISPVADTLGGDVVYKTVVDLDELLPGLRAGMSAEVHFETDN
jgi:HlyD family secretion protein